MSERKEWHSILNSIEDEYRHDLGLHLYSTFLLHQKDPLFPRRGWASWPVPLSEVPDPKPLKIYIDEVHCIDDDDKENVNNVIEVDSDESEDEIKEEPNEEEIQTELTREYRPTYNIQIEEVLTSPTKNMKFEINSLFQKKVDDKIKRYIKEDVPKKKQYLNKTGGMKVKLRRKIQEIVRKHNIPNKPIQQIVDPPAHIPNVLMNKLISKIDKTIDNLIDLKTQGEVNKDEDRTIQTFPYRLLNWQDILSAAHGFNTAKANKKLAYKFDKLFLNVKYNYKYDTSDGEESEDDYEESSESANREGTPDIRREGTTESIHDENDGDDDRQVGDMRKDLVINNKSNERKRRLYSEDVPEESEDKIMKRKICDDYLNSFRLNLLKVNLDYHRAKVESCEELTKHDYNCTINTKRN